MSKIIKVIYTEGEKKEVLNWKSLKEIKKEFNLISDRESLYLFNKQFKEIQNEVLFSLDDEIVKEYAKDYLYLKDEDDNDCEDKSISDYDDNELNAELANRKLIGYTNFNIIAIDLFTRFSRLVAVADSQELEVIISELENKYNL